MHKYEGFRDKPYLCPAHIWTIGWGHVLYQEQIRLPMTRVEGKETPMIRKEFPLKSTDSRVWSKDEIKSLFAQDIANFERGVLRLAPNLIGHQGAFDACVSFSFNAGLGNFQKSTIRMKVGREDWQGAADAFKAWTKGGGKVLPGLVKRRDDEINLFLSDFEKDQE